MTGSSDKILLLVAQAYVVKVTVSNDNRGIKWIHRLCIFSVPTGFCRLDPARDQDVGYTISYITGLSDDHP